MTEIDAQEIDMKIKRFSMAAVVIPAFLFLVLGCGTGGKSKRWEDAGVGHKTLAEGDVKVSARYLNMTALRTLHGYYFNPFNDYTEWPARVFVVDVTVESGAPVDVRAGEAVLATVAAPKRPIPKEEFLSYWYTTLEDNRDKMSRGGGDRYSWWSYPYVRDLIERTVLPAAAAVEAGGKVSGYLLFTRDHGDNGPATFTIPVFDAKGEAIREFTFEFTL
jgi:hypothetical protein